jgi:c-di-GMP-binding flagellar brake protein YcgR
MVTTELSVEIGESLQLQFVASDEMRYTAKVVGYLSGKSLVVTTPVVNGHVMPISEGKEIVVRLMSGNEIVGFTVSVLAVSVRPYAHLHLSFPQNVQAVTVRKALRVELNMAALTRTCLTDVSEIDPQQEAQAITIKDMSTSGALLIADKALAKEGQQIIISMNMEVADGSDKVFLVAVVRNIRTERGEKVGQRIYFHGVELRLKGRAQSVLVHAFVYQRIARGES